MRASVFPASIITLLVPVSAFALGIQVMINGQALTFVDVPQSAWFATHVQTAAEAGIVSGYKDDRGELTGLYGPGNNITIAEALKIASEGAGYDEAKFGSVIQSGVGTHWASPYVSVAIAEDFQVISDGANLDRPASRAEVAAMIASSFRLNTDTELGSRYVDVSASTEYAHSIEVLSRDSVVSGDTDIEGQPTGTFRPDEAINRAEVAKMVMIARQKYGTPGTVRVPTQTSSQGSEQLTVSYTNTGFSPTVLRIKKGQSVMFRNDSSTQMWVATNNHPSHTLLPGFDALQGLGQGEVYVHQFNQLGTWGYHNHLSAGHEGTIVVEE